MSSSASDAAFADILKRHTSAGMGGDLAFTDAFFSFLRRNTSLLSSPAAVEQIQRMALKHVDIARKEKEEQRKKDSTTKSSATPGTAASSASSSSSSSSSTTPATATSSAEPVKTMDLEEAEIPTVDASDSSSSSSSASKGRPPVNNGSVTSRYSWTQTLSDVTVTLPALPASTTSRQLQVSICPTELSISLRSSSPPTALLPASALHAAIHSDDSTWTLESEAGGKVLRLYLKKRNRMEWWPRLLQGEDEIDVSKISPENSSLSDLDGETRQTVEKMMLEQRMKAGGGRTDEESKKEQALKRFMEQHPEMDFSQAKIM